MALRLRYGVVKVYLIEQELKMSQTNIHQLNYKHLHHFWVAAKEGGVARASEALHLTPQTISAQIGELEDALGEPLFRRLGRRLELTHTGKVTYQYAEKMFGLAAELVATLSSQVQRGPVKLTIGIADVVPKPIAYHILERTYTFDDSIQVVCHEGGLEALLGGLANAEFDLILADQPAKADGEMRVCNHLLYESGVSFFAAGRAAKRYREGFPLSLHGAPMLVPTRHSALRQSLEQWLEEHTIAPMIVGEFEDMALMHNFGQAGRGIFVAPTAIEAEIRRQYDVDIITEVPEIKQAFYAIAPERTIENPAVNKVIEEAGRMRMAGRVQPGIFSRRVQESNVVNLSRRVR
jgi:LysR family transcriptional activator of nhaA